MEGVELPEAWGPSGGGQPLGKRGPDLLSLRPARATGDSVVQGLRVKAFESPFDTFTGPGAFSGSQCGSPSQATWVPADFSAPEALQPPAAHMKTQSEDSATTSAARRRGPRPRKFKKNSCQADGCTADLAAQSFYYIRNHICSEHLKQESIVVKGVPSRFCQRCGVSHALDCFEGRKRSCRASLARHKQRRQSKQGAEPAAADEQPALASADLAARLFVGLQGPPGTAPPMAGPVLAPAAASEPGVNTNGGELAWVERAAPGLVPLDELLLPAPGCAHSDAAPGLLCQSAGPQLQPLLQAAAAPGQAAGQAWAEGELLTAPWQWELPSLQELDQIAADLLVVEALGEGRGSARGSAQPSPVSTLFDFAPAFGGVGAVADPLDEPHARPVAPSAAASPACGPALAAALGPPAASGVPSPPQALDGQQAPGMGERQGVEAAPAGGGGAAGQAAVRAAAPEPRSRDLPQPAIAGTAQPPAPALAPPTFQVPSGWGQQGGPAALLPQQVPPAGMPELQACPSTVSSQFQVQLVPSPQQPGQPLVSAPSVWVLMPQPVYVQFS